MERSASSVLIGLGFSCKISPHPPQHGARWRVYVTINDICMLIGIYRGVRMLLQISQ